MRSIRLLAAGLAIGLVATVAGAQSVRPSDWGTLPWYRSNTVTVLNNARAIVEPVLPPSQRQTAKRIRYRVSAQPGVGAFAAWEDGRRLIQVTAGFVQLCDFLGEAFLFDQDLGASGCFDEYSRYLGNRFIENTERMRAGLPPEALLAPILFSQRDGREGACGGIEAVKFETRPDLGRARASMIEASIMFLYLHELGHHLLGHTEDLKPGRTLPKIEVIRQQEDAADRWAITTALKANYNLLNAIPVFSFISLVGGNSLESEAMMTHPLGIRRVLALNEEVAAFYKSNPKAWRRPPSLDEFLDELARQQSKVSKAIDALQPSANGKQKQAVTEP